MSAVVTQPKGNTASDGGKTAVNDVVIKIATVNGSGSQSANLILMSSIFKMGVPVSAKNLFPSNIAGLPTWFTIRANANGYLAQRNRIDICVAMNKDTLADDLAELEPGAVVVLSDALKHNVTRDDLNILMVPFTKLVAEACPDTRIRKKVINVIYVGVLASLLGIDMADVEDAISTQFGGKKKAVALNLDAAMAGYRWAQENLTASIPFAIERTNLTDDKIIIEGNEAAALGMLFGGVSVVAWYPITPSSSLCENLEIYLNKYRRDPETGKASFAVVQAEDEIASIGMVLGAGWTGARACTATAGPGISLMAEMAGLSYFAEIPAVIADVQRMGPSTGLPTRTSQGDILKAYNLSHGDCRHILLIPGTMEECFLFARESLNLAEEFQTMVFLMSDLDLGMNKWLADPFQPPKDGLPSRGKVLNKEALEQATEKFRRYADVDGDGIPYRTLPGTDHDDAAFFTRGTGHTASAGYSERADDWQLNMDRLAKKFATARTRVPESIVDDAGNRIGVIAYGSTEAAMPEARDLMREHGGIEIDYLRLRALPLPQDVKDFVERHEVICLIEQNRDAQVASILKDELPQYATRIHSVLHYNGMPIDAETIAAGVSAHHTE